MRILEKSGKHFILKTGLYVKSILIRPEVYNIQVLNPSVVRSLFVVDMYQIIAIIAGGDGVCVVRV